MLNGTVYLNNSAVPLLGVGEGDPMPSSAGPAGRNVVEPCLTGLAGFSIQMEQKSLIKDQATGFIAAEVKRSYT